MAKRAWKIGLGVLLVLPVVLVVVLRNFPPPKVDPAVIDAAVVREASAIEAARASSVAKTFPWPIVSQPNPSFCGPTSVANALTSLGQPVSPSDVVAGSGHCWTGL